jgi:3-methylcrotonyl-CoA carboxylase alpha subunit
MFHLAKSFRTTARSPIVAKQYSNQASSSKFQGNDTCLDSILVANRGEIALRVSQTAAQKGIRVTTLYTDPDARGQHAHASKWAFNLGDTGAYLDQDQILDIAKRRRCKAIHPGYGFLSENASFAKRCTEAGVVFIGPPWKAIEDMGDKARSKEIMNNAGVPCVPGYHGRDQSPETLAAEAVRVGFPALIKAVRGGGGKGMRIARSVSEFPDMLHSAKSESMNSFGNDDVLIERYISKPRHIEVQIFADKFGQCLALGERDCSIQRRHQKILEESPAPHLDDQTRKEIWDKARAAALAVDYEGAGTVEFIFDTESGDFFFMEMNTRLQVEHPVTEMVTGLDLVHWQIMIAEGRPLPISQEQVELEISRRGHAIEARIYAENPRRGFIPDSGRLLHVRLPEATPDVRIDTGFVEDDEVSSHYDPMISKLIVRADTRKEAISRLAAALEHYEVAGPITNIDFLKVVCRSSDFIDGAVDTSFIDNHHEELFGQDEIEDEILAQAAIASFLQSSASDSSTSSHSFPTDQSSTWLSAGSDLHTRSFSFQSADEETRLGSKPTSYNISLRQLAPGRFSISIPGSDAYNDASCTSTYDSSAKILTTYFPTNRRTSRVIMPPSTSVTEGKQPPIHIFDRGTLHRLQATPPSWLSTALGVTEKPNSLLSPMPCKILRVDVQPGDVVRKDQPLLVIESMKMETVVRSPGEGLIVKKVVHGQGEVVGSGVELVEFEDNGDAEDSKESD